MINLGGNSFKNLCSPPLFKSRINNSMTDQFYFQRYLVAQDEDYLLALKEIKSGHKESHWMWYIFPQIKGLGHSHNSRFYAILSKDQASEYLNHPILGKRLRQITKALLDLPSDNATEIFGTPDDKKLKSCMTLFSALPDTDPVFGQVLEKFFQGQQDELTLARI